MRAFIKPSKISGEITLPSSKSLAHRYFIAAALANGVSTIRNVSLNHDLEATIEGLKAMGTKFKFIDSKTVEVTGTNFDNIKDNSFDAHECASTLRMLIPIYSLFKTDKDLEIRGTKRLFERGIRVYEEVLKDKIKVGHSNVIIKDKIDSGRYVVDGSLSSQYISGLLFALPLLKENSCIKIKEPVVSNPYIGITIDVLTLAGIDIDMKSKCDYSIKGSQEYKPFDVTVESDYSQAAFFMALGAINNRITIKHLNKDSHQGDKNMINILRESNVDARFEGEDLIVDKAENFKGMNVELTDYPDLGPALFAVAACQDAESNFLNAERLRNKETNRFISLRKEFKKFNINFHYFRGKVNVWGRRQLNPATSIDCHNDHRICMAMAIVATTSEYGFWLNGIECVKKSYPGFFKDLEKLGVDIKYKNN